MPFESEIVIRVATRAGYKCEMCGQDLSRVFRWQTLPSFHAHSATGLHLVRAQDESMCRVTNAPASYKRLRGRFLPAAMFEALYQGRMDDGFCLCHSCHRGIHQIALAETKLNFPKHTGGNSTPEILEKTTLFFVKRGRF